MLRSLVGSEMCIRDRAIIDGLLDEALAKRARLEAQRDLSSVIVFPAEICLLYTSDAADDLLCVDLGGRRIIKKKKKQL